MPLYSRSIDVFTPWEKELVVEIEGHKTIRSFPMQGDTLFDHIMEAYLWRTSKTVASNLDDVLDQIEIARFSPENKYIRVKIRPFSGRMRLPRKNKSEK